MNPERVIAVKLADFGDALLTTPALRALRETYPGARLDVLTTPAAAEVYRCSGGLVDEVLVFEKGDYDSLPGLLTSPAAPAGLGRRLRRRRYDTLVLFHHLTTRYGAMKHAALALASGAPARVGLSRRGSRRGWFLTHMAPDPGFGRLHEAAIGLSIAEAAGARTLDESLAFEPGEAAVEEARRLTEGRGTLPLVAIHPGSGPYSPARRWAPERFAVVAEALAAQGAQVVLVGRGDDDTAEVRRACDTITYDLTDRTSLSVLGAVLAEADLLVCNDSGVMHLATAVGTPVVAVFGPTSPDAWGPWSPRGGAESELVAPESDAHRVANGAIVNVRSPRTGTVGAQSAATHRTVGLDLPCRPCLYSGYDLGSRHGCPTRDCVAWLSPESVVDAALESLSEPRL